MNTISHITLLMVLSLLLIGTAIGQATQSNNQAPMVVTATASNTQVRYIAVGQVQETRLQIFSASGAEIFDSSFRQGNLIDWQLQDQQGTRLADGSYLFLITVRDFSGRLVQKYGTAVLEQNQVYLEQSNRAELSTAQTTALESNKQSDTVSPIDRIGAAALNRTLELTAPVDNPRTVNNPPAAAQPANKVEGSRAESPQETAVGVNATGTGTQNRIAKWTDNAGTLGNSTIFEDTTGRIGIGTTAPTSLLQLAGPNGVSAITLNTPGTQRFRLQTIPGVQNWGALTLNANFSGGWFLDDATRNGWFFKLDTRGANASGVNNGLWLYRVPPGAGAHTDEVPVFGVSSNQVYFAGTVGIGTMTPQSKLDVAGDINVSGNAVVAGNIAAKYQDVAEWVPTSEEVGAGTVVILDKDRSNTVKASRRAYDTSVAGVVSAQPGVVLGEAGMGKVMVATTGRVKVKVDARKSPVRIGDLLVTSSEEGMAMRSRPIRVGSRLLHRPGTIIGKALEPLAKGRGEILVQLSLQ